MSRCFKLYILRNSPIDLSDAKVVHLYCVTAANNAVENSAVCLNCEFEFNGSDYKLKVVQEEGGFEDVTRQRKWSKVAQKVSVPNESVNQVSIN